MSHLIVTTSWDDGHKFDMRLANTLSHYGLRGTFYIAKNFFGCDSLLEQDIIKISHSHEIGAHTLTHPNLLHLSLEKARQEIRDSKEWLESLIGQEVKMFCYPSGLYNTEIAQLVKEVGFAGARTTQKFEIQKLADPYAIPTTAQIYPFPFRKKNSRQYLWRNLLQPLTENLKNIFKLGVPLAALRNPVSLAKATFDIALARGAVFHLWGHAEELERYDLWQDLEKICAYISGRADCVYHTNYGALIH